MKTAFLCGAALLGLSSTYCTHAQSTHSVGITLLSNQILRVTVATEAGAVCALQAARTLGSRAEWTVLGIGGPTQNGVLEFVDSGLTNAGSRFYRAWRVSSLFPITGMITGREDETFSFQLEGVDPRASNETVVATITRLPTRGQLFQYDGTPIKSVPAVLSDPARRGKFLAETNRNGRPYSSFGYSVSANGVASSEASVEVIVTPVPDPPVCQFAGNSTCLPGQMNRVQTLEDTSVIFALGVSDPDLEEEGDAIAVYAMPLPPTIGSLGKLYQVESDGRSRGAEISALNTVVTHPNHLLMYVPPPNANGCPLTVVDYWAQDRYGLRSEPAQVLLDVAPVNDAPVAQASNHGFSTEILEVPISLQGYDVDSDYPDLALRFLSLPQVGAILSSSGRVPVQTNQPYSFGITLIYQLPLPDDCNQPIPTGAPLTSFTWSITDPSNATAVATDTITLWQGNRPPTPIGPERARTVEHDTNGVAIALGGTDPDGNDVIPVILSLPTHGKLKWEFGVISWPQELPPVASGGARSVTYIPDADFASNRPDFGTGLSAPDSFRWTVKDLPPRGVSSLQSRCEEIVLLDVTNVNDAPIISGPDSGTASFLPGGHTVSGIFTNINVLDPDDFLHTGRETFHVRITSSLADRLILRNTEYGPFPGNNTPSLEFETTPGRLNRIFADGLEFVPAGAGSGSITIEVNDLGFAGLGGPKTGTKVIIVQVSSSF